jgi:hypothetical protein
MPYEIQLFLICLSVSFVFAMLIYGLVSPRYRHISRVTRFLMLVTCILAGVVLAVYVKQNL